MSNLNKKLMKMKQSYYNTNRRHKTSSDTTIMEWKADLQRAATSNINLGGNKMQIVGNEHNA